jgi:hypothetical protein
MRMFKSWLPLQGSFFLLSNGVKYVREVALCQPGLYGAYKPFSYTNLFTFHLDCSHNSCYPYSFLL